jgi:hypothetical protein
VGVPDEAKIRAHLLGAWNAPRPGTLSLAGQFADAFGTITAVADGLWAIDDFRPSEVDRYDALLSEATVRVRQIAEAALLDAVIDALAAFAIACLDAPRWTGT